MGARIDHYGPGAALQTVSILGIVPVVIFLGLWVRFRTTGGDQCAAGRASGFSDPA
jgi:hypothetical protein